jgi:LysR family hydrogen peroxide-inducible transcriptional activator
LFEDAFVLVMPAGHPLARRGQVREADLVDQTVLLLEDGHCLRDQALRVCDQVGASELGDFRATSLGTLVEMVASGLGVTLLPAMAVPSETTSRPELVWRPFRAPAPQRTIGLAWRRGSLRESEFRLLAAVLRPRAARRRRAPRQHGR